MPSVVTIPVTVLDYKVRYRWVHVGGRYEDDVLERLQL
jgi:hypothetical protein